LQEIRALPREDGGSGEHEPTAILAQALQGPADQQGFQTIAFRRGEAIAQWHRHDPGWECDGKRGWFDGCARFRTAAFDVREEQRIRSEYWLDSRTKSGSRLFPWAESAGPDPDS